jgi:hypothetical protein
MVDYLGSYPRWSCPAVQGGRSSNRSPRFVFGTSSLARVPRPSFAWAGILSPPKSCSHGNDLGQRLAVLAVEKRSNRFPPRFVRFTRSLTLIGVHRALGCGVGCLRGTATGAAVSETRFVRFQFELFLADGADFDGESHALYDTTLTMLENRGQSFGIFGLLHNEAGRSHM